MSIDFTKFPFTFKLHLGPYIDHVLKVGETSPELVSKELLTRIKDTIGKHPQLMEIFDHVKDIEPYRDFFRVLFSTIIPLKGSSSSVQGVTLPFTAQSYLVA